MLGYTPLGRQPPGQTPSLPSACWDTHPCPVHAEIDMATATDGMHPTGMHSCFCKPFLSIGRHLLLKIPQRCKECHYSLKQNNFITIPEIFSIGLPFPYGGQ